MGQHQALAGHTGLAEHCQPTRHQDAAYQLPIGPFHINKRANDPKEISGYGAKYPLISISRLVLLLANTLIAPLVPAGTMAELATTPPFGAFTVETFGSVSPVGNAVKYPNSPPDGTTAVRFNE